MKPRVFFLLIAVMYLAFGAWASYQGWRSEWSVNGVMLRGGGILSILVGLYALVRKPRV